jgi:hypothetical protein
VQGNIINAFYFLGRSKIGNLHACKYECDLLVIIGSLLL